MMKFNTERFGEVELDESFIFDFIEPILGYEHLRKFALIDHSPESPFKWIQSLEDSKIAFPVTLPSFFNIDYQFVIPEDIAKKIDLKDIEGLLSLNIVCIPQGNPQNTTINLCGPLIINTKNKKALQLILVDGDYPIRYKLFQNEKINKGKILNNTQKCEK